MGWAYWVLSGLTISLSQLVLHNRQVLQNKNFEFNAENLFFSLKGQPVRTLTCLGAHDSKNVADETFSSGKPSLF